MRIKINKNNYFSVFGILKKAFKREGFLIKVSSEYDVKKEKVNFIEKRSQSSEIYKNLTLLDLSPKSSKKGTPLFAINLGYGSLIYISEGDIINLKNGSEFVIKDNASYYKELIGKSYLTYSISLIPFEENKERFFYDDEIRKRNHDIICSFK